MLRILSLLMVVLCGLMVACGGGDDDAEDTPTPSAEQTEGDESATTTEEPAAGTEEPTEEGTVATTTVEVTLAVDGVTVEPESGPAGSFTFDITNVDCNESAFVIIRADGIDPEELPTTDTGEFDGQTIAGAYIWAQSTGQSGGDAVTMGSELDAGDYVLTCGRVDAEGRGYFGQGVYAPFAVE